MKTSVSTTRRGGDGSPADEGAGAGSAPAAVARDRGPGAGWHPGVRLLLALLVMIPLASTAIFLVTSAHAAWSSEQHAQVAAKDAADLAVVASARAQMNTVEVPLTAVSYAAQLGVSEPVLDQLLHPPVPFETQLALGTRQIEGFPTFSSTATLRADVARLRVLTTAVAAHSVSFDDVVAFTTKMGSDIDDVWYADFNRLQRDISAWQPPGSFEVHASALRQIYQAFLAGGQEVGGAIYVLEGIGPSNAKQELVQAAGVFEDATAEFVGHMSPDAAQAWHHLQTDPADVHFGATIQQAVTVALNDEKPPFAGNLGFAGSSMAPGLRYLGDQNKLVTAGSQDLRDTALAQSAAASHRLTGEILFLVALALVCVGGIALVGRMLTHSLKNLASRARQVHGGNFDLEPLPDTGPREVVTTTAAFNDMTSTLKAIESKAIALATENLSDPRLLTPLPGRTGRALQASIDTLATRMRERELQRKLLHEAATHDSLTGLLNRPAILEYLTHDVSRRREAGETVAVLFVDLDGLKPLNDVHGHDAGDAAILATAIALTRATDQCDVVGRLGGDEFLVVLCHDHSCDGDTVVDRIRDGVAECRVPVDGGMVPLAASVGVALAQCDHDTDPMTLVRQADEAMYEAKKVARSSRDWIDTGG